MKNQPDVCLRTSLYSLHEELGARFVTFAGHEMPVQFTDGISREHIHTRCNAGLFDISHMGQLKIYGENSIRRFQELVPSDIESLDVNQQKYTMLTNSDGGIIDDIMVTRLADCLFVVINAARFATVLDYLNKKLAPECDIQNLSTHSLLALQGPQAAGVLARFVPGIDKLAFLNSTLAFIDDYEVRVNRCGYTGEDGFEISVMSADAESLARKLLAHSAVKPVGLGARDTLRLEAGLCLYGQDIDEYTTPVEANLSWVVAGKFRKEHRSGQFPGAERILSQLENGPDRLRVGIQPEGRIPVRGNTVVFNELGHEIGKITSGGFGPTVAGPIAMGYLEMDYTDPGKTLVTEIRGRSHKLKTRQLPFVKPRYYR